MLGQLRLAIDQIGKGRFKILAAHRCGEAIQRTVDERRLVGVEHADSRVDMDEDLRPDRLRADQQQRDPPLLGAALAKRRNVVAFDNAHRDAEAHGLILASAASGRAEHPGAAQSERGASDPRQRLARTEQGKAEANAL